MSFRRRLYTSALGVRPW